MSLSDELRAKNARDLTASDQFREESNPATGNQLNDQDHQCNHEQEMDEATCDAKTKAESPQDQQYDEYCPKHTPESARISAARV